MKPFEKCPVCGGELEAKRVEKLLRGAKIQFPSRSMPKFAFVAANDSTPKTY